MTTRPITALALDDLTPGAIPTGRPELTWIDPQDLLVDEAYQRELSEKSHKLIRRIIETFDWRRFKPPTCVWTAAGLEVLDGQHSAIAAASHPAITQIPVVVVEAEQIEDRAGAFLGLNRDRLAITTLQLHAAAVVAGDETAAAVERVCAACDVTVLRMPRAGGLSRPRDMTAVKAVADMIRRVGEPVAIHIVRTLAEADLAPISAAALRAAEAILVDREYADQVEPAELTRAIVALGAEADREAGVFAATHCTPRWRGLVAVWFKKAKKRKPAAQVDSDARPAVDPASRTAPQPKAPACAPRFLGGGGRVSGTSARLIGGHVDLGEPPAGRSALDQRKAGGRSP